MGPADVPSTNGHVWSLAFFRVKTTVSVPLASTLDMFAMSEAGPFGSLILLIRLKEKTTSLAVSGSPLANLRPDFRVQVYSVGVLKSHFSAASPTGLVPPGGTFIRNW
jgi:hypothetical protein